MTQKPLGPEASALVRALWRGETQIAMRDDTITVLLDTIERQRVMIEALTRAVEELVKHAKRGRKS